MKHRRCVSELVEKHHPCFSSLFSPGSSCKRVDSRPEKERIMVLAATENKYELDLVEIAMKIKFPENEIRNHVDRTRKYNRNILGGSVSEEEDQMTGDMGVPESSGDHLDVLATAQEEEVEALTSLATANRILREARAKQHQVRMARGFFLQQQSHRDRNNGRPERKCVFFGGSLGPYNVRRSKEGQPKRKEMRQHMWHTVKSLCPFTPKRACPHKKRWRQDQR